MQLKNLRPTPWPASGEVDWDKIPLAGKAWVHIGDILTYAPVESQTGLMIQTISGQVVCHTRNGTYRAEKNSALFLPPGTVDIINENQLGASRVICTAPLIPVREELIIPVDETGGSVSSWTLWGARYTDGQEIICCEHWAIAQGVHIPCTSNNQASCLIVQEGAGVCRHHGRNQNLQAGSICMLPPGQASLTARSPMRICAFRYAA